MPAFITNTSNTSNNTIYISSISNSSSSSIGISRSRSRSKFTPAHTLRLLLPPFLSKMTTVGLLVQNQPRQLELQPPPPPPPPQQQQDVQEQEQPPRCRQTHTPTTAART